MKYNKSLLFCPKRYSLASIFRDTLEQVSNKVELIDVSERISTLAKKIKAQTFRFPYKIRNSYDSIYLKKINKIIIENYDLLKPDLVFVYNTEYLLPETCLYIKRKSKLVFFLGDSPFFTPMNDYFLAVIGHGDLILAPDTFWLQQMRTIGYKNCHFFVPGIDNTNYFKMTEAELKKFNDIQSNDIFYNGVCYTDSWGYKKAMLMNKFVNFNFSFQGNKHWIKWFEDFPELEKHFSLSNFVATKKLNAFYNKTKMVPVDGNPGILNGFHIRLMESLGAGALPLVEFRRDVKEELLKGSGLQFPLITDYNMAGDLANYFLKNENERMELTSALAKFIKNEYSAEKNSQRLLEYLE